MYNIQNKKEIKGTNDDFKHRLIIALNKFFNLDDYLINNNVHEQAMSHRIALYLSELFYEYDVDCEHPSPLNDITRVF